MSCSTSGICTGDWKGREKFGSPGNIAVGGLGDEKAEEGNSYLVASL